VATLQHTCLVLGGPCEVTSPHSEVTSAIPPAARTHSRHTSARSPDKKMDTLSTMRVILVRLDEPM